MIPPPGCLWLGESSRSLAFVFLYMSACVFLVKFTSCCHPHVYQVTHLLAVVRDVVVYEDEYIGGSDDDDDDDVGRGRRPILAYLQREQTRPFYIHGGKYVHHLYLLDKRGQLYNGGMFLHEFRG